MFEEEFGFVPKPCLQDRLCKIYLKENPDAKSIMEEARLRDIQHLTRSVDHQDSGTAFSSIEDALLVEYLLLLHKHSGEKEERLLKIFEKRIRKWRLPKELC